MPVRSLLLSTLLLLLGSQQVSAQAPPAPSFELDGDTLTIAVTTDQPVSVRLPCEGSTHLFRGTTVYVGCTQGVVEVDVSDADKPKVLGLREVGAAVTGFFVRGDVVWAEMVRIEARPLSALVTRDLPTPAPAVATPEATPKTTPEKDPDGPPSQAELKKVGEVVEVRKGEVVVTLGSNAGIIRGRHVEIFAQRSVDLGGGEEGVREELLAVGKVATVTPKRSVVALGLNERVAKGSKARLTSKGLTSKTMVPPRVAGLWTIDGNFRPFLALGTFGFGTISDLSIGYRFESPLHVKMRLEPIGLGLAEEGNIVAVAGNVFAGYDTALFEVALGVGWSAVNDALELGGADEAAVGGGIPTEVDRVRDGLSIAQTVRLGALDGLNLSAYNDFLLYEGEFHYGGTTASLQMPVSNASWLIFRGGGGISGYGFGEIGLRVLTVGNGNHGSLFLTPSLGGAYLFGEVDVDCEMYDPRRNQTVTVEDGCVEEVSYGGPMVGLGVEWRQ